MPLVRRASLMLALLSAGCQGQLELDEGPAGTAALSSPFGVPGRVEAEAFQGYSGSTTPKGGSGPYGDLEPCSDALGCGQDVGWIGTGEWFSYTVSVAVGGVGSIDARVASALAGRFHLEIDGVAGPSADVATGGWQAWTTVSFPIALTAGPHAVRVVSDVGGFNVNYLDFKAGAAPPPGGTRLRTLTFNVQHGCAKPYPSCQPGTTGHVVAQQAQFIKDQDADIVFMQEVSQYNEDQPTIFRQTMEQLTGRTWYSVWAPGNGTGGVDGDYILSRVPITASSMKRLIGSDGGCGYPNRVAAQATVQVNGVTLNVFSTHNDVCPSNRDSIIAQLMAFSAGFGVPQIIGGDFNSDTDQSSLQTLLTRYTNPSGEESTSDYGRVDFIFQSQAAAQHLAAQAHAVVAPFVAGTADQLSDHLTVRVDFLVQ